MEKITNREDVLQWIKDNNLRGDEKIKAKMRAYKLPSKSGKVSDLHESDFVLEIFDGEVPD
jgi:hypothetical protein